MADSDSDDGLTEQELRHKSKRQKAEIVALKERNDTLSAFADSVQGLVQGVLPTPPAAPPAAPGQQPLWSLGKIRGQSVAYSGQPRTPVDVWRVSVSGDAAAPLRFFFLPLDALQICHVGPDQCRQGQHANRNLLDRMPAELKLQDVVQCEKMLTCAVNSGAAKIKKWGFGRNDTRFVTIEGMKGLVAGLMDLYHAPAAGEDGVGDADGVEAAAQQVEENQAGGNEPPQAPAQAVNLATELQALEAWLVDSNAVGLEVADWKAS